jgi:nicotinic acid mononucleotide adenylyltransferase|tara:strand:+ start:163 stop:333 length:171 start_codon:yes stop_codon:yes gene_type:complete
MLIQKMIVQGVIKLLTKQFKLNKILKYVEEPNELDQEVEQLKKRVDMLEIILKKEK